MKINSEAIKTPRSSRLLFFPKNIFVTFFLPTVMIPNPPKMKELLF